MSLSRILETIHQSAGRLNRTLRFMEVCGTHTMSAFRSGLHSLLPENVVLLSGPGCPVCVTPNTFLDDALALALRPEIILSTFGDMLRVPGTYSSLEQARAQGAQVRTVYSPQDALNLARQNPTSQIVFLAVGFETTAPAVAWTVREASRLGIDNFSILSAHKTIPPAMAALLQTGEIKLDGFLCPGHVSIIIGAQAFQPICTQFNLPCVVSGFEPQDMLQTLVMLLEQLETGQAQVQNQYQRSVAWEGHAPALRLLSEVFEPVETLWRGLGAIPGSGLRLKPAFEAWDAQRRFGPIQRPPSREPSGCRCGDVLRGVLRPDACPCFGNTCTPLHPLGACMVSSEGTCAAYYRYSRRSSTPGDAHSGAKARKGL